MTADTMTEIRKQISRATGAAISDHKIDPSPLETVHEGISNASALLDCDNWDEKQILDQLIKASDLFRRAERLRETAELELCGALVDARNALKKIEAGGFE